jgi:hypothetical protein
VAQAMGVVGVLRFLFLEGPPWPEPSISKSQTVTYLLPGDDSHTISSWACRYHTLQKLEKKINVSRETLNIFFIIIGMLSCFV